MIHFSNQLQVLVASGLVAAHPAAALSGKILKGFGSRVVACPENYAPCTCELTEFGREVSCIDVTVEEIRGVFFRTVALVVYSVTLSASDPVSVVLPYDLLSDKRAEKIFLNCPLRTGDPKVLLTIDPQTFQYSRVNTTQFEINNCDLANQPDMLFLSGFSILNSLRIGNSSNVEAFATLPSTNFPALKELAIYDSTGLGTIVFPDLTPARLERLYLAGNGLTDTEVNGVLVSVGSSSSVSSLKELYLGRNALTKVPRIASFSQLGTYYLNGSTIAFMSLSSLIFGTPVVYVGLKSVGLTAIEGGAFQGKILDLNLFVCYINYNLHNR